MATSARVHRRVLAPVAATALAGAGLLLSTSTAGAAPVTETFEYNGTDGSDGSPQEFVVPVDVCQVTVDAQGAEGGQGNDGLAGGAGGRATATLTVTPGETLQVNVGGEGGDGIADGVGGPGGFNGGAVGGTPPTPDDPGGGGGGASDVRQGGSALAN
ncbi:MAG: hypothetical protein ACRDZV_08505, partial [Acidimicrobiia bacterium]